MTQALTPLTPADGHRRGWHSASSGTRLVVACGVGLLVGVVASLVSPNEYGPAIGWDAAAAVFLLGSWLTTRRLSPEATRRLATREDHSTGISDAILLAAAVASLLIVGLVLFGAGHSSGLTELVRVLLGVGSVAVSWGVVHTVFCLRYARLYYTDPVGGIDFHGETAATAPPEVGTDDAHRSGPADDGPCYADFAYLAFTVGMTFQVSDTDVTSRTIRRLVLRHSLISYLFGTVILAVTVNLVAGLSK